MTQANQPELRSYVMQLNPEKLGAYITAAAGIEPPMQVIDYDPVSEEGKTGSLEAIHRSNAGLFRLTGEAGISAKGSGTLDPDYVIQDAITKGTRIVEIVGPAKGDWVPFWDAVKSQQAKSE